MWNRGTEKRGGEENKKGKGMSGRKRLEKGEWKSIRPVTGNMLVLHMNLLLLHIKKHAQTKKK